jgi:hypothetical protein
MMETRILKDKDYGGDTLYPHEKVRIKTRIVEDTLYPEKFAVPGRTKIPTCPSCPCPFVAGPWENKDTNL